MNKSAFFTVRLFIGIGWLQYCYGAAVGMYNMTKHLPVAWSECQTAGGGLLFIAIGLYLHSKQEIKDIRDRIEGIERARGSDIRPRLSFQRERRQSLTGASAA